ncbi:MAG: hypothetical protein K4305_09000 [Chlorobium sp.]|uniref:hypothetical protein n=1 Tax=Chlorobium sp. TaxID=1095 RepID=UPI002F3FA642
MATVRDLMTQALRSSGLLAAGESPAPEDVRDAFDYACQLLGQWSLQPLLVPDTGAIVFSSIDDVLALPAGYEIAIRMSVALYMREDAGLQPSRMLIAGAGEAIEAIKQANAAVRPPADMTFDPILLGRTGYYDIYNGTEV